MKDLTTVCQSSILITMTTTQAIRQLLKRGMSPEEIASAVGVSARTIDRWKHGTHQARRADARRVERLLKQQTTRRHAPA